MVPVQGNDPHWSLSARALVAALVMYATIEARKLGKAPTIARVRELLCQASDAAHAGNNWQAVGIPKLAEEMARSKIAGLRNKAAQFTDWNREIQSIASTARIQTEPFDDPEIAADLARDSFDFRTLKREPVTVYLVLPPDMMQRHAKWLRLVLTAAIQSVMRPRRPGEPKVIFALDEFFALGHMEIISTVWSLTRGYGVQMLPILQSLLQLKKLEPEMWENFLGMAGAVLSFGANDLTSAEWLSRRAGETTRNVATFSESTSTTDSGGSTTPGFGSSSYGSTNSGWSTSSNKSTSFAPAKTALITSHRMMGLRSGFGLVALDGVSNLIPAYLPAYYEVRETAFRARRNPYYLP
jgi:type IV secretion system protein VirD4